jgi:cellobiose PTS system EIIA component
MMDHDHLNSVSMQIILHAGDARMALYTAFEHMEVGDYPSAELHLQEAQAKIQLAHQAQTLAIQAEARGESLPYSPLFTHAQDTLMTIMSELNLTKKMIGVFKRLETLGRGQTS